MYAKTPQEQIDTLTMISNAQREKINQLLKTIEVLTQERDLLLERVTLFETQSIEVTANDNVMEAANVREIDD